MPRKSASRTEKRSLEVVRAEMESTQATCDKLRRLLESSMSVIRSSRFQPYVIETNGNGNPVKKRHPALKEVREYRATLKAAREHLADLRAEEADILEHSAPPSRSRFAEFAVKPLSMNGPAAP
jgi:hypothetical protein